ncbi:CPBP family intramembrane glutamic endopeptidase [Siphonobacter curvatus]|uniref:CPBP family intramembrane metalloprotease n=1 Tax=Siphonobacter curvatus TaxID=2094562 RepID=A0A2S7ISP0_9BACT|nr:CPBP family intramembrane glutamic endopeptidase [Siphonobacter curvatus]PQA60699.1 CPBP family intramembrane metalloprotease [Siphonobacter curvatus]
MNNVNKAVRLPVWKTLLVLIGFPIISYLLSLILLQRDLFSFTGWDFFSVFWILITIWYIIQIKIITYILSSEGYTLEAIGYRLDVNHSKKMIGGYLLCSLLLLITIEISLQSGPIDPSRLSDFANLTPTNLRQRIIFILMGLFAGLSEEMVYRGFAINSLMGYRINKWLSIILASIPFVFQHGLKAIPQFSWFFSMGLFFGFLFILTKKLTIGIIVHWLIILSAVVAILSTLN